MDIRPLVAAFLLLIPSAVQQPNPDTARAASATEKRTAHRHHRHKAHTTKSKEAESAPVTAGPTPNPQAEGTTEAESHKDEFYDAGRDNLYRWYLRATILGVASAVAAVGMLFWQMKLLLRSTKAAEEAAKAASENAAALMNFERARIDATFERHEAETKPYFSLHNLGKSPATIESYTITHASYPKDVKEVSAPAIQHPREKGRPNAILMAGMDLKVMQFDPADYLSAEELSGEHTAVFTIGIEYTDIFEKLHETEVSYSYNLGTGTLEYLPQHTKYN
jgi:hypothetical protein